MPANLAASRQFDEVFIVASLSAAGTRKIQRMAEDGEVVRIHKGIYVSAGDSAEIEMRVIRNWQRIAGAIVPGGVLSHLSALTSGLLKNNTVTISHSTLFGKKVQLSGVTLVLLKGPGPLPGDLPLGSSGLYWAGRTRMVLENLGNRSKNRAGREEVEMYLLNCLNVSGEKALTDMRDQAAGLGTYLGLSKNVEDLRQIIGALLGTHNRRELRSRDVKLMVKSTPVDNERMARFEVLANYLRITPLPAIANKQATGKQQQNFAFIESYFSNYVEGTKFAIEEARRIVMRNKVIEARLEDSHDILGVFRLAMTSPFRDSPPVSGAEFLTVLASWHHEMLQMRPESNPGQLKQKINFVGISKFLEPEMVRGTLEEGSVLARSVPEGLARAIYYAFLVSEVHPFEDGNGRLSRLVMNAELTRFGLNRIIVPTLFHPHYVDSARKLTRNEQPDGFARCLSKMAAWCSQFDYSDLDSLIPLLMSTKAFEESPLEYRLLNLDGSIV